MGEGEAVSDEKTTVDGWEAVVPSGGMIAGTVILTRVDFPVSKRVVSHAGGTPFIVLLLNADTMGELPAGSTGTGMKNVTLYNEASVVRVQV
jgi:hypothetical protein